MLAPGCGSTGGAGRREAPSASPGHGYALLHEILGQERQVSKLLLIKRARDPLKRVVNDIAETSDAAYRSSRSSPKRIQA